MNKHVWASPAKLAALIVGVFALVFALAGPASATMTKLTTVPVGGGPLALAVSPDGKSVWVANSYETFVSIIETPANVAAAKVELGGSPTSVAISTDGSRAYVVLAGEQRLAVIDTATRTVIEKVYVDSPYRVAVSPNGKFAYVTVVGSLSSDGVAVFDTATNTVVKTIPLTSPPEGIAVSPDGKKVYVAQQSAGSVVVIDTATQAVTKTITGDFGAPYEIAFSPDGKSAYVTDVVSGKLSVINVATDTFSSTVTIGVNPFGVAVSPDGSTVYVTDVASSKLVAVGTKPLAVTSTLEVGQVPTGVGVSVDGSRIYVALAGEGSVAVVDAGLPAGKKPQTLPAGAVPKALANPGSTLVNKGGALTVQGQPVTAKVVAQQSRGELTCLRTTKGAKRKVSVMATGRCNMTVRVWYTAPGTSKLKPFSKIVTYKLKRVS